MHPKCYALDSRIKNLASEIEALVEDIRENGRTLQEKRRYRDLKRNEIEALKQRLYNLENEIQRLAEQRSETQQKLTSTNQKIADAERELNNTDDPDRRWAIQDRLWALKSSASQQQETIGSISSRIQDKRDAQQQAKWDMQEAEHQHAALNSRIEELEFETSQMRGRKERREQEKRNTQIQYEATCTPDGELKNPDDDWFME